MDSEGTAALTHDERRLPLSYPIVIANAAALRKEMSRAQAAVGRRPGAKGTGNATRRVRLVVAGGGDSVDALADRLEES